MANPISVVHILKSQPLFCLLTFIGFILVALHVTAVSGSWITYDFTSKNQTSGVSTTTEFKLGLFNGAENNSWSTRPYSVCYSQALQITDNPIQLNSHIAFCNGQLAAGILVLVNLFLSFGGACLLTLLCSQTLLEHRVVQAKWLLLASYACISLSNMIAFSIGAGVIYGVVVASFPSAYYGVGFAAAITNWLLAAAVGAGVYFLIDRNGYLVTSLRSSVTSPVPMSNAFDSSPQYPSNGRLNTSTSAKEGFPSSTRVAKPSLKVTPPKSNVTKDSPASLPDRLGPSSPTRQKYSAQVDEDDEDKVQEKRRSRLVPKINTSATSSKNNGPSSSSQRNVESPRAGGNGSSTIRSRSRPRTPNAERNTDSDSSYPSSIASAARSGKDKDQSNGNLSSSRNQRSNNGPSSPSLNRNNPSSKRRQNPKDHPELFNSSSRGASKPKSSPAMNDVDDLASYY